MASSFALWLLLLVPPWQPSLESSYPIRWPPLLPCGCCCWLDPGCQVSSPHVCWKRRSWRPRTHTVPQVTAYSALLVVWSGVPPPTDVRRAAPRTAPAVLLLAAWKRDPAGAWWAVVRRAGWVVHGSAARFVCVCGSSKPPCSCQLAPHILLHQRCLLLLLEWAHTQR